MFVNSTLIISDKSKVNLPFATLSNYYNYYKKSIPKITHIKSALNRCLNAIANAGSAARKCVKQQLA